SSRRRHTRSDRDWSSDVCSSDLEKSSAAHMIAHRSASSFTAYPACMRGGRGPVPGGGPPPGQRTIKPPITSTKPPNQTHQTSGLIVKRKTACSVPFRSEEHTSELQ